MTRTRSERIPQRWIGPIKWDGGWLWGWGQRE